MNSNEKIILCTNCKSKGWIEDKELEDYHKCEYRHWIVKCAACEGRGRLVETTTVTYKPYLVENEYPTLKEEFDSSEKVLI